MQWEEIRNEEEKMRDIVLVDWNTSIENDGVSAITHRQLMRLVKLQVI